VDAFIVLPGGQAMKVLMKKQKQAVEEAPVYSVEQAEKEIEEIAGETSKSPPMPLKFPATLDDFFRLVVNARTKAEATARFRLFLSTYYFDIQHGRSPSTESEALNWTVEQFECIKRRDKAGGVFSGALWDRLAFAYREWWDRHVSNLRSESSKKRKRTS
jgi:hypothetical protein